MNWQSEARAAFADLVAVFGIPVLWMDSYGTEHKIRAVLSQPTEEVMGGTQLSNAYTIEYDVEGLPELKYGDLIEVDGIEYAVREVLDAEDGLTRHANLKQP